MSILKFDEMYESIQTMTVLEIINDKDTQEAFENKYNAEITELKNLTLDHFKEFTSEEQFKRLRIYDVLYRVGMPYISDELYDSFEYVYKKDNEDTIIMFEPSISAWNKEKHLIPMGSLSKCSTIEEIQKWNLKDGFYTAPKVLSEKLDGISLELIYEKGKFIKAITRGDGIEGDNITDNAIYFDGVIKQLSEKMDCSIRGEVIITKENFERMNNLLESKGFERLKNPRNGVAGQATKFKNRDKDILELISFMAYEIKVFNMEKTGETVV